MKISATVLKLINKPAIRLQLAVSLGVTEQTIIRYISTNSDDLTKAAAMKVIREATGLDEKEILQELGTVSEGGAAKIAC